MTNPNDECSNLSFRAKSRNLSLFALVCYVQRKSCPGRSRMGRDIFHYSPSTWSPISIQRGFSRLINSVLFARDISWAEFLRDGVANIPIMLVVTQFCTAVCTRECGASAFAMLPGSARQRISHPVLK